MRSITVFTLISKKTFPYKNNHIGVKVEKLDEADHYRVIVACVRGKKKVVGRLTCQKKSVTEATKRLLKRQLIT